LPRDKMAGGEDVVVVVVVMVVNDSGDGATWTSRDARCRDGREIEQARDEVEVLGRRFLQGW
jgi:hypothetical protein